MHTLEERNLNRLRKGKMMLEFGKQKKSFGITLLLMIIGGWLGAHRFYLGHKRIGFAFLAALAVAVLGFSISGNNSEHPAALFAGLASMILSTVVIIEIVLSYWVVGRENERIKARLSDEYGVNDLKVLP